MTEEEARGLFADALAELETQAQERVTAREQDVLYHRVVVGLNNRDIATVLVVSQRTVESHLAHAAIKLRYPRRLAALERALLRAYLLREVRAVSV